MVEGDAVLVGFKHCVISVPLIWCSVHTCRSSCLFSSDPYCGWNGTACVPFVHPYTNLEQNLDSPSPLSTNSPCNNEIENSNRQKTEAENLHPTDSNDLEPEIADTHEEGTRIEQKEGYTLFTIIWVAVTASVGTLIILFVLYFCCYRRCLRSRKRKDLGDFTQKQMTLQHSKAVQEDETLGSFSKRVHKTFCGMKLWFFKAATPMPTHDITHKRDANAPHQRRQNDYSEAPLLKQKDVENARITRQTSSRLYSTCSSTSREDSLRISFTNTGTFYAICSFYSFCFQIRFCHILKAIPLTFVKGNIFFHFEDSLDKCR